MLIYLSTFEDHGISNLFKYNKYLHYNFCFNMTTKQFLTLSELQNLLQNDEFFKGLEEACLDVVELPTEKIDTISQDVSGKVDSHINDSETALG